MDDELRFHIEELAKEKIAMGLSPEQARREAVLEFGGHERVKEDLRDVYRIPFLESSWGNLRFALRMMRNSPSFSLAVVITLALGIGANSAVFSAINAILLRPLSFPDSDQLVLLQQFDRTVKAPPSFVAPVRLEDWNRLNNTFQAISGYYIQDVSDVSGSLPEKVSEALVAPRFFEVWGISPLLGRDFNSAEEHFGGPNAVVISHRYWVHRFNSDPGVIGKRIRLDKCSYTVIGVMPERFRFRENDVDIWSPIPADAPYAQGREDTWYNVFGRMKSSVGLSQARASLATVQADLGRQFPKSDGHISIDIQSLKSITTEGSGKSLWILFGSVSLLLLIACTNIAALLLARATQREREISVRFSLGATRTSIILQLLTECFVLSILGSTAGLFVASAGAALFRHYASGFARTDEITLDGRMVLYTLACAVAVTLLCGLVPAIYGTRTQFTRSQVSARNPLQWLMVGTQVALAVMLLFGAGLMLRSLQELGLISLGFDSSHVLTFRISGSWGETTDRKELTGRIDRALYALRATPGVIAAATSATLPGVAADSRGEIKIREDSSKRVVAESRFVSSDYFSLLRIPVMAGQTCRSADQFDTAVVNRSFANAYFSGGAQPIGQHIENARVIGIVGDAREQGLNHASAPTVYMCASAPLPTPYFLVRTQGSPLSMADYFRKEIHSLEPARSVFGISLLDDHLTANFAQTRLRTVLLTAFSLTAVVLACTGLYGTLSYFVTVRKREVGLRLALGATRRQIISRFLMKGLAVSMIGCGVGLCLAFGFSNVLAGMLFGVSLQDPRTFAGVIGIVLTVAACASLVPAVRAAAVEPMKVLREE